MGIIWLIQIGSKLNALGKLNGKAVDEIKILIEQQQGEDEKVNILQKMFYSLEMENIKQV